jgi:Trk K+ transport system NAD-binding subunit
MENGGILVCGLGALGAECVRTLRGYGQQVRGVDEGSAVLPAWSGVPVVRGDCRDAEVLREAGLELCRAVLLVTDDSRVNIEAAMAARRIKASIRIVARAAEHSLGDLMSSFLGDFVCYDPSQLAAGAFALAALRSDVIGHFHVEGRLVRVLRHLVGPDDPWLHVPVGKILRHETLILRHEPADRARPPEPSERPFHSFDPEQRVEIGDTLTVMTVEQGATDRRATPSTRDRRSRRTRRSLRQRWEGLGRPVHVLLGALTMVLAALLASIVFFPLGEPSLSRTDALFTALVLMTGGTYADLFPAFNHLSDGLRLLTVVLSMIGTLTVGLVYAWLTDRLMTWRLRLVTRRPSAPREGHVLVVGMGRVGQHVAAMLDELGKPVAAVALEALHEHAVPQVAVLTGNGTEGPALEAANILGARGVLAATPDDWTNLEIALQARRLNPGCGVVIRAKDLRFSRNVAEVFPDLQVLCVPAIAAKAFAAAALGSRVLDLFQAWGRTVYVVEYRVRAGDGLNGRLLAEIAEGYYVVPFWHEAPERGGHVWSPASQAVRLAAGHRLVLLGTSDSLRAIERGQMDPRLAVLGLAARRAFADSLPLVSVLVQQLGWTLERAHALIATLPCVLPESLYPHQAYRLRTALETAGASVELRPVQGLAQPDAEPPPPTR